MDGKLSEQIETVIDVLAQAQTQAALVSLMMRKQRIYIGLEYSQVDDDIAHLIGKLRYIKRVAEHKEHFEAATERTTTAD
jgi:hypothetical protein